MKNRLWFDRCCSLMTTLIMASKICLSETLNLMVQTWKCYQFQPLCRDFLSKGSGALPLSIMRMFSYSVVQYMGLVRHVKLQTLVDTPLIVTFRCPRTIMKGLPYVFPHTLSATSPRIECNGFGLHIKPRPGSETILGKEY